MNFFTRKENGETFFENGVYVGDILMDNDGEYKWWPTSNNGYLDAGFLRVMYQFLEGLNEMSS